jgi:hypothetical protein
MPCPTQTVISIVVTVPSTDPDFGSMVSTGIVLTLVGGDLTKLMNAVNGNVWMTELRNQLKLHGINVP